MSVRQCVTQHDFSPAACPMCRAASENGGVLFISRQREMPVPVAEPPMPVPYSPPSLCIHLGEETGRTVACVEGCGKGMKLKVFRCDRHGECTQSKLGAGLTHKCGGCQDRSLVRPFTGDPVTRHLAYHIYPVGNWEWNVEQLLRRISLFNGVRAVGVVLDHRTASLDAVRMAFRGEITDFSVHGNDPQLREVVTWKALLERTVMSHKGLDDATFFGHSKGVARRTTQRWAELMYETCLDYWPTVERVLGRQPLAGSFKKVGHGFSGSKSSWHYSGTFYWARNCHPKFYRDWQTIDRKWWGTESWPGLHFRPDEAGTIFKEGTVPDLDLYRPEVLAIIEREYELWKAAHRSEAVA